MALLDFSEWAPDRPRIGNQCVTALNVVPRIRGYGPFSSPVPITASLGSPCVGAISFERVNGVVETFAGTASGLFRRVDAAWVNVSRAIPYAASPFWRFAVFGGRLVATNGVDNPQKFDLDSSALFADLPGAPVHDFTIVIRDTLVALGVNDGSNLNIKFSAVNDSEKWSPECGGGGQPVPDGGPLIGGTGGKVGVVIQKDAVTVMTFVGGNLRFTFDKLEGSSGAIAPGSIAGYKGRTFYLSREGFQQFGGSQSQNISAERVTDHFFESLDETALGSLSAAFDPDEGVIVWSYPTAGGAHRLIIYSFILDRWTESDADIRCLVSLADGVLGGFNASNALVEFTGGPLSATLSTGDVALAEERNVFVRAVRGLIDGTFEFTIGKRNAMSKPETTQEGQGVGDDRLTTRADGRFHRFEMRPTGVLWDEAVGFDVEAAPTGRRP